MKIFLTLILIAAFTVYVFASDLEEEDVLAMEELIPVRNNMSCGCGERVRDLLCIFAFSTPLLLSTIYYIIGHVTHNADLSFGAMVAVIMSAVFLGVICIAIQVQNNSSVFDCSA